MIKTPNKVGRPQSVNDNDRKQSYTISCTTEKRKALIKKFGSLTAAINSISC